MSQQTLHLLDRKSHEEELVQETETAGRDAGCAGRPGLYIRATCTHTSIPVTRPFAYYNRLEYRYRTGMVHAVVNLVDDFVVRFQLVKFMEIRGLEDILVQQRVEVVRRVVTVAAGTKPSTTVNNRQQPSTTDQQPYSRPCRSRYIDCIRVVRTYMGSSSCLTRRCVSSGNWSSSLCPRRDFCSACRVSADRDMCACVWVWV